MTESLRTGLGRIAAVRDAVGAGKGLLVDCHWRLDDKAAAYLVRAAKETVDLPR